MSDRKDLEGMRESADLKVGVEAPQVKCTPFTIDSTNRRFWDGFGDDKQAGEVPESKSNP